MEALYKHVQHAHVSFYLFVFFGQDYLPVEVPFQGSISLSASKGLLDSRAKPMALRRLDADLGYIEKGSL